jgi:hypothetical protein
MWFSAKKQQKNAFVFLFLKTETTFAKRALPYPIRSY